MRSYRPDLLHADAAPQWAARPSRAGGEGMRDPREAEADRAAQKATESRGAGAAQGLTSLSQHGGTGGADAVPGGGRPLEPSERALFEPQFGRDFSHVRVHSDAQAAQAAEEASAEAFTVGQHIVFGAGRFQPGTPRGHQLLAHELAHTAQQQAASASGGGLMQREPKDGGPKQGIGSAPPSEKFERAEGVGPEDAYVLFDKDSVRLSSGGLKSLLEKATTYSGPVTVEIHGYASGEGDPTYNSNLSAHRAAAIKALLNEKLPPGSKFVLYARGETNAFGKTEQNRRAGVKITPQGTSLDLGEGSLEKESWRLELSQFDRSRLRKSVFGSGTLQAPQSTILQTQPTTPVDLNLAPRDSSQFSMFRKVPIQPPLNLHLAPMGGDAQIDWAAMNRPFTTHGIQMDDQAQDSVMQTWQSSYNFAIALRLSPKIAAWAANRATEKSYDEFFRHEHPSVQDRLDKEWELQKKLLPPAFKVNVFGNQFGLDIPPIPIITPASLRFIKKMFGKETKETDFEF